MVDVIFNTTTCDLNVEISADRLTLATKQGNKNFPDESNAFWYLMGSAKATHSPQCLKGKVYFETVVTEHLKPTNSKHSLEDIAPSVRIGWSTMTSRTNVGEATYSFGYCSDGSKVSDSDFTDYGESFGINEVVISYIDFDSKPHEIGFIRHGVQQGTAFQLPKNCHKLFPHVSIRNAKVICNFGLRAPTFPPPSDYIFIGDLSASDLNSGPTPPKSYGECDVVMMVGLHGSGKSRWASSQVSSYPAKCYHRMGTDALLNSMTDKGKSLVTPANHDKMIKLVTSTIQQLISHFHRLQNVIFDDCFIEGDIRAKLLSALTDKGYKPRVVIVMPAEKNYEKYLENRIKSSGNLPITIDNVLQQKVNLSIPEQTPGIKDLIFTDLQRKTASILAIQYNQEGARKNYKSRFVQNQLINSDPRGLNELERFLWSQDLLLMTPNQKRDLKKTSFIYTPPVEIRTPKTSTPTSHSSSVNNGAKRETSLLEAVSKPMSTVDRERASLKSSNSSKPLPMSAPVTKNPSLVQRRLQLARTRLTSLKPAVNKPSNDQPPRTSGSLMSTNERSRYKGSDSRYNPSSRGMGVSPLMKYKMDNDRRNSQNSLISYNKLSGTWSISKRTEKTSASYRSDHVARGLIYNPFVPQDYRNTGLLPHRSGGSRPADNKTTHRFPQPNRNRSSRYDADPSRLP